MTVRRRNFTVRPRGGVVTTQVDRLRADPSNGYEAVAHEFIARRQQSGVGVQTVLAWARNLPRGAAILDLGCGFGMPISAALMNAGNVIYGVEASPTLCAAFSENVPHARVACESVEQSSLFGRTFDGVLAWGLIFLLSRDSQVRLIERIAALLEPNGRFLFTAPAEECTWVDMLTGQTSQSLGKMTYKATIEAAGLVLGPGCIDEGENHYYDVVKTTSIFAAL
jgi:SAM-dependent methyltransferase